MKMYIDLTPEQVKQLQPFFEKLKEMLIAGTSGFILAQPLYPGSMQVVLLTREQGEAIQKITGMSDSAIEYGKQRLEKSRKQLQANT
ncbi:MAG: hypothetical protein Q7J84_14810 [Sulfuricaulis sp.]|nr:hypothetical protein [Sulfuricaulis sp.]